MNKCCEIKFTLEEQHLTFKINNSNLDFNADLGYLIGTQSYNSLMDKPSINYITLVGNKLSDDLGLQDKINDISDQDIDNMIYL